MRDRKTNTVIIDWNAKSTMRIRGVCARLLTLTVSTVLVVFAAEGLVRWGAPQQLIQMRPDIWIPDHGGLGWRMAGDIDTQVNTGERDVHLQTDDKGHRIGPGPSIPASRKILALGDSFLAAIEVSYADIMTTRLGESLSQTFGQRVQIVNTGVGGWDPNHYLLKARAELSDAYDLVIVFLFLGNDAIAKRFPEFGPKQAEVVHPLRWPRSFEGRELVNAWLYPLNDFFERRSHFFILFRQGAWNLLMRAGLSSRRFPAADLRREATSPRWETTGKLCLDIAAEATAHSLETLFVLLPGAYHVDTELGLAYARNLGLDADEVDLGQSNRLIRAELEAHGLRYLDVTTALRRLHASGVRPHGQIDTHLSPDGHAEVARELMAPVLELLRSPSLPP